MITIRSTRISHNSRSRLSGGAEGDQWGKPVCGRIGGRCRWGGADLFQEPQVEADGLLRVTHSRHGVAEVCAVLKAACHINNNLIFRTLYHCCKIRELVFIICTGAAGRRAAKYSPKKPPIKGVFREVAAAPAARPSQKISSEADEPKSAQSQEVIPCGLQKPACLKSDLRLRMGDASEWSQDGREGTFEGLSAVMCQKGGLRPNLSPSRLSTLVQLASRQELELCHEP